MHDSTLKYMYSGFAKSTWW